jgi:Holliday junction DNA helicase RuvB
MDNKILNTIIDKFKESSWIVYLATTVSRDAETIEEVYEPFLIQEGFCRTPRVEKSLIKAYRHLFGKIQSNIQGGSLFKFIKYRFLFLI